MPRDMFPPEFVDKVREAGNGCWEWTASVKPQGYGEIRVGGVLWYAHRFSWQYTHGPIPDGLVIRHKCDNRLCVNPAHLVAGLPVENVMDTVFRKGLNQGQANGMAKLTAADVAWVRQAFLEGASQSELARKLQVNRSCIHKIVHNKHWRV